MRIVSGKVVGTGNTVEFEGEPMTAGSQVRLYVEEDGIETVDDATADGLNEAILQADRGEARPMAELIAELKAKKK
jgi:hypothetical protein